MEAVKCITGGLIRPGGFAITDRAISFCSFQRGAKILDIGCGSGATVNHLIQNQDFDAFGVDKDLSQAIEQDTNGFSVELFEDYTHELQTMWGQMIFEQGAKSFYCSMGVDPETLKRIKCGYFLIIAKKNNPHDFTGR